MNAIDDMATEGEELAKRVQEEGREACERLRDLTTRLEQAKDELETGRDGVESLLEALTAGSAELKTEAVDLLAPVTKLPWRSTSCLWEGKAIRLTSLAEPAAQSVVRDLLTLPHPA